jgi:hypothetical protein
MLVDDVVVVPWKNSNVYFWKDSETVVLFVNILFLDFCCRSFDVPKAKTSENECYCFCWSDHFQENGDDGIEKNEKLLVSDPYVVFVVVVVVVVVHDGLDYV